MTLRAPARLGAGGKRLWSEITDLHELDPAQRVQLEEACRAKDRCDKLDLLLQADVDTWTRLTLDINSDGQVYELRITQALAQANTTANVMKQLLAAMRLPEAATGKRPQVRSARGAYKTSAGVSSLDRARAAKTS